MDPATRKRSEIRRAKIIADAIYDFFHPQSVIDCGCGVAMELSHLKSRGVRVKGLDKSPHAKTHGCISEIEQWDLKQHYPFNEKYDVCLCFDAIEHLYPEHEWAVLNNLINASDNVIISVPWGTGDPLHFNEQPPAYWVKQFDELGYQYDEAKTQYLKDMMRGGRLWVVRNVQFFKARTHD
ncbi:unnamed protein product [marine sediment metagenome]|uniref:Uncharacterized protein n=1 Tax=marine sediment metagenome TaxID=412755 RepID=X1B1G9_9ZZZZ